MRLLDRMEVNSKKDREDDGRNQERLAQLAEKKKAEAEERKIRELKKHLAEQEEVKRMVSFRCVLSHTPTHTHLHARNSLLFPARDHCRVSPKGGGDTSTGAVEEGSPCPGEDGKGSFKKGEVDYA